jgi:hypothetical protein
MNTAFSICSRDGMPNTSAQPGNMFVATAILSQNAVVKISSSPDKVCVTEHRWLQLLHGTN